MQTSVSHIPAVWAYGAAVAIFAAIALVALRQRIAGITGNFHLATSVIGLLWSATSAYAAWQPTSELLAWSWRLDVLRVVSWLAFAAVFMSSHRAAEPADRLVASKPWFRILVAGVAIVALAASPVVPAIMLGPVSQLQGCIAALVLAVAGLLLAEQFIVSTVRSRWWAIKPFCVGFTAMMGFDLLYFSAGMLFRQVDPDMWSARGIVHAAAAALVMVSAMRLDGWRAELHLSRGAAMQFTSLLLAGAFLVLVSMAGYWVAASGGNWGGTLRVALIFAAILVIAMLLLSGRLRARLRIFLVKNFFTYRYDYRTEWSRFTDQFGAKVAGETHQQQIVRALADLVESTGGQLWLKNDREYRIADAIDASHSDDAEAMTSSFAEFLSTRQWVIDVTEFSGHREKYSGLTLPDWLVANRLAWIVVPLVAGDELVGFVVLNRPRAAVELNWEVRDILKMAGAQVAVHLSQMRSKERLVESEKFDAFNRMSAYVVHDLKNLIAQLDLMVRNAARHRDNPEFQADMLDTVRHAVSRMQQLMLQLRSGTVPADPAKRIDLSAVVAGAASAKSTQEAQIECDIEPHVHVLGHADRLERVAGHLIQNAIDASPQQTKIGLKVAAEENSAILEVSDSGVGMSETFLRDKLFHPFQTTKPTGMGIGMYESGQYVKSLGGRVDVKSVPFAGSTFRVILPLAAPSAQTLSGKKS
jgi:putative PEP-CTERM system histidine kinase